MTAKEFTENEANCTKLAKLLNERTLQQAFEVVLAGMIPRLNNEGVVNPTIGNAYMQQLSGARSVWGELKKLTRREPETKKVEGRRLYTEDDRERLIKQQQKG